MQTKSMSQKLGKSSIINNETWFLIKDLNFLLVYNSNNFLCNNSPWKILILQSNFFWNLHSDSLNLQTRPWIFVRRAFRFHVLCAGCRALLRPELSDFLFQNFRPLNVEFCGACLFLSWLLKSKIKQSFFFQYYFPVLQVFLDRFLNFFFYFFISKRLWTIMEYFYVIDPLNF